MAISTVESLSPARLVAVEGAVAVPHEVTSLHPLDQASRRSAGPVAQVDRGRTHLRGYLVAADALAIALAWSITLIPWPNSGRPLFQSIALVAVITILGIAVISVQGLYFARNSAIRTLEMARLLRATLLIGILAWLGTRAVHIPFGSKWLYGQAVVGTVATFAFLLVTRATYRAMLASARRSGRYLRDVLLIGTNTEAVEMLRLLSDHVEAGFRVVGVLGDRNQAVANNIGDLYCGEVTDAARVLGSRRASGAVVIMGATSSRQLNEVVRQLQSRNAHIQLSAGVDRIDYRRLRALPVAYQPLFYVEPPTMARPKLILKRTTDIIGSFLALFVTAPLFGIIALAVKLCDGGPVFFKQTRVGSNGRPFKVFKFRTMVVDAEERLGTLTERNERVGPLFKIYDDPRITRVGRFLRRSSLDELPQLFNVLWGEMSLVGPRPALPSEAEAFDEELTERTKVRPGVTGLWQVEARDNPSFAAYRRLDLYYVDNWSLGLDLVILVATIEQVVARVITTMLGRHPVAPGVEAAPVVEAAEAGDGASG
jgi:exopolysaccharide biosynthesis polyprenyl glycosylphosphotransferase